MACGVEKKFNWDPLKIFEREKTIFCTKPFVYLCLVTSLAIAILGILALVGSYYPSSVTSRLGSLLGQNGALATITLALILFASILIGRLFYSQSKGRGNSSSENEPLSPSDNEPLY